MASVSVALVRSHDAATNHQWRAEKADMLMHSLTSLARSMQPACNNNQATDQIAAGSSGPADRVSQGVGTPFAPKQELNGSRLERGRRLAVLARHSYCNDGPRICQAFNSVLSSPFACDCADRQPDRRQESTHDTVVSYRDLLKPAESVRNHVRTRNQPGALVLTSHKRTGDEAILW